MLRIEEKKIASPAIRSASAVFFSRVFSPLPKAAFADGIFYFRRTYERTVPPIKPANFLFPLSNNRAAIFLSDIRTYRTYRIFFFLFGKKED